MATAIKNGKLPISEKKVSAPICTDDDMGFGNMLFVDKAIIEKIREEGFEARFINAKKLKDSSGYHPKGWKPYEHTDCDSIDTDTFKKGNGPDKYIMRGDCVLAVRSIEVCNKHREMLKKRTHNLEKVAKRHSSELKREAMVHGVDIKVHEGYDD